MTTVGSAHVHDRGPTVADAAIATERALIIVLLLMFSQALLGPLLTDPQSPDGSPILRLMWLPMYAIAAGLTVLRWRSFPGYATAIALILAPVFLAVISPMWATDPGLAGRRAFALVMTTVFGVYLAIRLDWNELLQALAVVMAVLVVGSYIACILFPGFGVHATVHPGAWKALWWEKNTLGAVMARAVLIFICAGLFRPDRRRMWLSFAVLAMGLVFLSTSKTSLLALITVFATLGGIWIVRRGPAVAVVFGYLVIAFAGAVAAAVIFAPAETLALLGRDVTLTGRTDIWSALLPRIEDRPWLGYGYDVFWEDELGPAYWVHQATDWDVPTAHNGWLEVALSLGKIGLTTFAIGFFAAMIAAARRLGSGRAVYFAAPWLILFMLFSISESAFLQRNAWEWVIYVTVAVKLIAGDRDQPAPEPSASTVAGPRTFAAP